MSSFASSSTSSLISESSDLGSTRYVNYDLAGKLFTDFMISLLGSRHMPYPYPRSAWQAYLPSYVAAALRIAGLDIPVLLGAMTLLCRYKEARPNNVALDDDAYKLFIASYVVAFKVMAIQLYPPSFWTLFSGRKFEEMEIMGMEAELCRVINLEVQIDAELYTYFHLVFLGAGIRRADWVPEELEQQEEYQEWQEPPPRYEDFEKDILVVEVYAPPSHSPQEERLALEEADSRRLGRKRSFREKAMKVISRALSSSLLRSLTESSL